MYATRAYVQNSYFCRCCHPPTIIFPSVISPGARESYLPLLRFKPTKVGVLLGGASAKRAVLSLQLECNGNAAFGSYWKHEISHQTGEDGDGVGSDKTWKGCGDCGESADGHRGSFKV